MLEKLILGRYFNPFLSAYKTKFNQKYVKLQSIQFPERFKGTIVEKWKDYWLNLIQDYKDVAKDTILSSREKPKRTAALLSLFTFGAFCMKTNPDEINHRDAVLSYATELIMIGPAIRNPEAKDYLEEIESYYTQGVLNKISFGLFTLLWKDTYNTNMGLYKAQCSYLSVPFYKFHEQIVDVGFMNKWYFLDKNMKDFDVNPEEWASIVPNSK